MKKNILFATLLVLSATSFSQQNNPSPSFTKQDYLQKSSKQKTAAWLLLGGGLALSSIGVITAAPKAAADLGYIVLIIPSTLAGNPQPEPQNNYTAETILLVSGFTAMLSSIPLFIASGKNKRKARSLSFKNETAPQIQKSSFVYRSVPSVNLKISL